MADFSQSYATVIDGSVEDCFAALVDFADYPRWSSPITECKVLDRHADGLPRRVAFALDMTLKTIRYTLAYTFDPPRGGTWKFVDGDLHDIEGSYTFTDAKGRTKAVCTQSIDIGFWIPGPIRRTFERKALQDSVEEFKKAVEARARAARA